MHNTFFYGEKVAKISAHLHQNPAHRIRIDHVLNQDKPNIESIWSLCADAARVFDTLEDLASDLRIDWGQALYGYSIDILGRLLSGERPDLADLVFLASRSIESER